MNVGSKATKRQPCSWKNEREVDMLDELLKANGFDDASLQRKTVRPVPSFMRIDQFVIRTILFSSGQYPHTPRQKKRTCPEETNMSGRNEQNQKK